MGSSVPAWRGGGAWAAAAILVVAMARPASASPATDALLGAAKSGSLQDVQREIALGGDVNAEDEDGWTPLMAAAGYNPSDAVAELLLRKGADVNAWDAMSMTPLSWAAMHSPNPRVITLLLQAGADVESADVGGDTPLMFAAWYNPNAAVLSTLLAARPNLEARDHAEETALLLAARYNNADVVTRLLDAGADARARDSLGLGAFDYAKENAKLRATRILQRLQAASK